ncbi:hypothetical protein ACQ4PT_069714 [Festuca glaucescens]
MAATESAGRRGQRKAKEAAVGAAARALFYPTLLYNVVRSKVQAEFRWWDEVDQVKYKNMTPTAAFEYVRSKRARVLLTRSQWKVVQEFSTKVVGAAASKTGDVVLSTEDGSGSPGVIEENASLSSHKTTLPRPMMKMLSCLLPSPVRSGNSLSYADLHT